MAWLLCKMSLTEAANVHLGGRFELSFQVGRRFGILCALSRRCPKTNIPVS